MIKRKLVTALLIFLAGLWIGTKHEHTVYVIKWDPSESAATKTPPVPDSVMFNESQKVAALEKAFSIYNSPMASQSAMFVALANRDNLDYRLLPAIAFTESTLCKYMVFNTHNCLGYGSGLISFDNFEAAESAVSQALSTSYYYHKWRQDKSNIYFLGEIYNGVDAAKWANSVEFFMNVIEGR